MEIKKMKNWKLFFLVSVALLILSGCEQLNSIPEKSYTNMPKALSAAVETVENESVDNIVTDVSLAGATGSYRYRVRYYDGTSFQEVILDSSDLSKKLYGPTTVAVYPNSAPATINITSSEVIEIVEGDGIVVYDVERFYSGGFKIEGVDSQNYEWVYTLDGDGAVIHKSRDNGWGDSVVDNNNDPSDNDGSWDND